MLRALPTFLLVCFVSLLTAQVTINNSTIPQLGDTLFLSFPDSSATVDLIGTGGPHVWDFSQLTALQTAERMVESLDLNTIDSTFANADVKIQVSPFSANYYTVSDNEFSLVGNQGSTALIEGFAVSSPFSPAFVQQRAPFDLNDQFGASTSLIVAIPVDSLPQEILEAGGPLLAAFDSVRLNTQVMRDDVVDAYGTLTVDGITYDVLRERRLETREVLIEAKLGFLPWTDITAQVIGAIPILADAIEGQDSVVTYNFWANDNIEPVAAVTTEADGETITSINFKTNRTPSSVFNDFLPNAEIKMYPNPARHLTTFEASGLLRGDYTLQIRNVIGRRIYTQDFNSAGSIRTDIDVSQLPSGIYLYSLTNSRGRILATKRLLVGGIRP